MAKSDQAVPAVPPHQRPALPPALRRYRRPLVGGDGVWVYCDWQKPNFWPEHRHAELQILCGFDGADCRVKWPGADGQPVGHQIPAGHIWIMPPGLPHEVHWREAAEVIVLLVKAHRVLELCGHEVSQPSVQPLRHYAQKEPAVGVLCEALRDHARTGQSQDDPHIGSVGTTLASFILRAHFEPRRQWQQHGPRLREVDFRRVELHIAKYLNKPYSLAAFARTARLSPAYFCRAFKATTVYRPRDFFNRRRILWAKELLETGQRNVSQVAYELGIFDLGHFGRLFRRFLHASPRTFLPRRAVPRLASKPGRRS
jgi:AraC family transcriptional regulator